MRGGEKIMSLMSIFQMAKERLCSLALSNAFLRINSGQFYSFEKQLVKKMRHG